MVAVDIDTSVRAGAVPDGVLKVPGVLFSSGLRFKLVVEFVIVVQSILATVPFLYSAGGAIAGKMVPEM
jgi:hypothetical protein